MELSPPKIATVSVPTDLFKCPVCLDLPPVEKQKVYQCKNGHLRCEQCDEKLRLSQPPPTCPTCPTCRCTLHDHEQIRNMIVEESLEYIESPCPFESDGCSVVLPRKILIKHLEECLFRSVRLCALLGFNDCSFDSFKPDGLIRHFKIAHNIPHNTNEFTSYDFNFGINSNDIENTSTPKMIKTVMSPQFRLLPIESRPFFIHLLKEDEKSDGFYFLCLFVGENETDAERFFASYYFSGTDSRKCVISWPTVWYKHVIRSNDAGNVDTDVCEFGFRLSRSMLKRIQGKAKSSNVFMCIRAREEHSKWLTYGSRWQSRSDSTSSEIG